MSGKRQRIEEPQKCYVTFPCFVVDGADAVRTLEAAYADPDRKEKFYMDDVYAPKDREVFGTENMLPCTMTYYHSAASLPARVRAIATQCDALSRDDVAFLHGSPDWYFANGDKIFPNECHDGCLPTRQRAVEPLITWNPSCPDARYFRIWGTDYAFLAYQKLSEVAASYLYRAPIGATLYTEEECHIEIFTVPSSCVVGYERALRDLTLLYDDDWKHHNIVWGENCPRPEFVGVGI